MTFKPEIWHPIAVVLSVINLVGVGLAVGTGEPWHAAAHGAVALAFGLGARRLRPGPGRGERQARVEDLEAEMSDLRQELTEAQERLDFTERMLAQGLESRRVGPER